MVKVPCEYWHVQRERFGNRQNVNEEDNSRHYALLR
jgi:hypothetical protein